MLRIWSNQVALMGAELAVVEMIDRDQRVDAGGLPRRRNSRCWRDSRLYLGSAPTSLRFCSPIAGCCRSTIPCRTARGRPSACFHRAGDTRMLVRARRAASPAFCGQRLDGIDKAEEEAHEGRHLEKAPRGSSPPRATRLFSEMDEAARTPRDDLLRCRLRHIGHRVIAQIPAYRFGIASMQMDACRSSGSARRAAR